MTAIDQAALNQRPRKRRRSREPDWETFYRNGWPEEVIVIEDSPEPEAMNDDGVANGGTTPTNHITQQDLPTSSFTPLSSTNHHNDAPAPSIRNRTRQQVTDEAEQKDTDGPGEPFEAYIPPPFLGIKADYVDICTIEDDDTAEVDDEGYYIVVLDAYLTDRYQIRRFLGQGTFGTVVEAYDQRRNKAVAIKIVRWQEEFRDAAMEELRVLATLQEYDETNDNRCIHFSECFDYRGHICIVTELLDESVMGFLEGNMFVPFPNDNIQSFARQLLTSAAYLHKLGLIHTDIKPDNIMLKDCEYQTLPSNQEIPTSSKSPSSFNIISNTATERRVLRKTDIQLIDFGSAIFGDETHPSEVTTRNYRAPEIIMGLGWSHPCDIWSIGCTLVEFFTGEVLFLPKRDDLTHLAMMEALIGRSIDAHLIQNVKNTHPASQYFNHLKLDYPKSTTRKILRRRVENMKCLEGVIRADNTFNKNFLDFLKRIFVYDPADRMTAEEALNHPWLKEVVQPDDGTEAVKIRADHEE